MFLNDTALIKLQLLFLIKMATFILMRKDVVLVWNHIAIYLKNQLLGNSLIFSSAPWRNHIIRKQIIWIKKPSNYSHLHLLRAIEIIYLEANDLIKNFSRRERERVNINTKGLFGCSEFWVIWSCFHHSWSKNDGAHGKHFVWTP